VKIEHDASGKACSVELGDGPHMFLKLTPAGKIKRAKERKAVLIAARAK